MMLFNQKLWKGKVFCLSLLFVFEGLASSSSIESSSDDNKSFILFNSMNFKVKNFDPPMVTGQKGNTYQWDACLIDPDQRKNATKFDMDVVHQKLEAKEGDLKNGKGSGGGIGKDRNVVTASFTLFITRTDEGEDSGKYYAIDKSFVLDKKGIDAFISGFSSKNTNINQGSPYINSDTYPVSNLYRDCLRREKVPTVCNNEKLSEIIRTVKDNQKRKVSEALKNLEDSEDILEMEQRLKNYDKLENIASAKDENSRKYGGYGPIGDSEQFLLHYLEKELIQTEESLGKATSRGLYMDWLTAFTEEQYSYIKKECGVIDYKDEVMADQKFQKGKNLSKNIQKYIPVGCILQVFSTRELCEYCGTSFLTDFYHEEKNFAARLKTAILEQQGDTESKYKPFLVPFVSSRERVGSGDEKFLRPRGTISDNLFGAGDSFVTEDDLMDLEKVAEAKKLPIFERKEKNTSSSRKQK